MAICHSAIVKQAMMGSTTGVIVDLFIALVLVLKSAIISFMFGIKADVAHLVPLYEQTSFPHGLLRELVASIETSGGNLCLTERKAAFIGVSSLAANAGTNGLFSLYHIVVEILLRCEC